jgi:hypothetical protein
MAVVLDLVTVVLVLAAAGYLARRAWRKRASQRSACGGCEGCAVADRAPEVKPISLDRLRAPGRR